MKNKFIKVLSMLLIMLALVASLASCDIWGTTTTTTTFVPNEEEKVPEFWNTATYTEDTELGEGSKTFTFTVDAEGYAITFTIHTDAEKVGEALLTLGLVEGEDGQYGLYVKKVNGMLADWDIDQTYWAFYENGAYGNGVDVTGVVDGYNYSFVRTK